jgi:Tfp pilus assembly protein PilO
MNKLSKDKRNQLVLAVVVTLAIVAGLYLALIRMQLDGLKKLNAKVTEKRTNNGKISETIKNSKEIEAELKVISKKLDTKEEDMASGDFYSFMITLISNFKQPYGVDIPQFTPASGSTDVNLLPKFPYKQYSVTIVGSAFYHDLGQFVAEFENRYPSSRVLNLELSPASIQGAEEREKLSFRMEIISLVKSSGARPVASQ